MLMMTIWRPGVYHLLHMCHVYIKVRIKLSASECFTDIQLQMK